MNNEENESFNGRCPTCGQKDSGQYEKILQDAKQLAELISNQELTFEAMGIAEEILTLVEELDK